MTRQRKIDPDELEREYVFGSDSLQSLADRHGLSKSAVAEYASKGRWADKRRQFKGTIIDRIRESLAADWAQYETDLRKSMIRAATSSLAAYVAALDSGAVQVTAKDAIAWITLLRTMLDELRPQDEPEPEEDMDPKLAEQILAQVESMLAQ